MKKCIQDAYDNCVLVLNNGREYEFYKRLDRLPKKFFIATSEEYLDYAKKHNLKHMNKADFDELWILMKRDNKKFNTMGQTKYD